MSIDSAPAFKVPILTYHAGILSSNDYLGNDHVALAADLALLDRLGWRIVPLHRLVATLQAPADADLRRCVALTCDDGTDLDVRDIDFAPFGPQRSFRSLLAEARGRSRVVGSTPHMTNFVIADPVARHTMDRECLANQGWISDDWWPDAHTSGWMEIGCHSWDHNHPVLPAPGPDGMPRGDFFQVDSAARAEFEIDQAVQYINARIAPGRCRYFCYPYGHANDFLRMDYLPRQGPRLGLEAAFGVQGEPVTPTSDPWHLPRYVCGWHWKSPDELEAILAGCLA